MKYTAALAVGLFLISSAIPFLAQSQVGTTFPPGFPVITNPYLGVPVIGFGSNQGPTAHVPVILARQQRHSIPHRLQPVWPHPRLRSVFCEPWIRQHRLDASSVKLYAAEFCSTKDLRQASREQVASFI